MDHGDWPRLFDEPYNAEEVKSFAERILDATGEVIELDLEGNYYDLDVVALAPYVRIHSNDLHFVLRNPVGRVFALEQLTDERLGKPLVQITMTPAKELITSTDITFDISTNKGVVELVEWQVDDGEITQEAPNGTFPNGAHTVRARAKVSGIWSEWASVEFYVLRTIDVQKIVAGKGHTLALLKDGTVWVWGVMSGAN